MTGQPVPKFDPFTGQQNWSEPVPPPNAPRFDPMTGQPIPKFDPITGQQNWFDVPQPVPQPALQPALQPVPHRPPSTLRAQPQAQGPSLLRWV